MAYSETEKENIFNDICTAIAEEGISLRKALARHKLSSQTFYVWIDEDETLNKSKQYTRATEMRADILFDETIDISDATEDDIITDDEGNQITNHNVIQRDRLRVDTRKWAAGKLRPKKYGDSQLLKLGNNEGNELKINAIFSTDILNVPTNDSTKEDSEPNEAD